MYIEFALLLNALLLGVMTSFMIVTSPTVFKTLDEENSKKFQKEIDETVINEDFWIFFRYEQEIEKIKDTLDSMIFGIVMNMEIKISHLLKNNRLL